MGLIAAFKDWTKAERDKLPAADFGDPGRKLYPIETQDDVDAAASLIGKAKDKDAVKARIIAIAKRKGLRIPDAWKSANHTAEGETDERLTAEFAVEDAGRRVEGDVAIYPNALLFRAGAYADKQFDLSPEEMAVACDLFTPVGGNIQHTDFLSGRACEVRSIRLDDADPFTLRGEVAVPLWLDENLQGHERKLSAEWDRASKTLTGLALCVNPRVPEAALMSAYAAFATRHDTGRGQMAMQELHDTAARYGAVCKRPKAEMASRHEADAIQEAHDLAIAHGATCDDTAKRPYPMFSDKTPGGPAAQVPPKKGKERPVGKISEFFAKVKAAADEIEIEDDEDDPPTPPAKMSKPAKPAAADGKDPLAEELRLAREQSARFQADNERLRLERVQERAVAFADAAIAEERAFPPTRETLTALYVQAATDDALLGVVKFDGGKTASRVDMLTAEVKSRPAHQLTREQLDPKFIEVFGLTPDGSAAKATADGKPMSAERKAELVKMTGFGPEVTRAGTNGTSH